MVTRLDRLARSTRDLLNTLAAITASKAGSLGDLPTSPAATTSAGRLYIAEKPALQVWCGPPPGKLTRAV